MVLFVQPVSPSTDLFWRSHFGTVRAPQQIRQREGAISRLGRPPGAFIAAGRRRAHHHDCEQLECGGSSASKSAHRGKGKRRARGTTRDFVSRTAKNLTVGCQDDAIVRQPGHVSGPVRRGHVAVERVVCGRRRERGDAISQCGELDAEGRVKKFGGEKWCAG